MKIASKFHLIISNAFREIVSKISKINGRMQTRGWGEILFFFKPHQDRNKKTCIHEKMNVRKFELATTKNFKAA